MRSILPTRTVLDFGAKIRYALRLDLDPTPLRKRDIYIYIGVYR